MYGIVPAMRIKTLSVWVIILYITAISSPCIIAADVDQSQVTKWFQDIAGHVANSNDWREIQQYSNKPNAEHAVEATLIRSRFLRCSLGQTTAALKLLIPLVWNGAPPQVPESVDIVRLSSMKSWKEDSRVIPLVMEIARCYAELKDAKRTFCIFNTWKDQLESSRALQIYGADAMGDCLQLLGHFEEVTHHYEFVQQALNAESKDYPLRADLLLILNLLPGKWAAVQNKIDIDAYGQAFVLYRIADRQRRFEGKPVFALAGLMKLRQQYPNTVFPEAASAYIVETLFDCAGQKGNIREEAIKEVKCKLDQTIQNVSDLTKIGVTDEVRVKLAELVAEQKDLIEILQAIPDSGEKAANNALVMAKSFLSERPLGLYRGEIMIALGDYYLTSSSNVSEAIGWYNRAVQWYDDISHSDHLPEIFSVEQRVAKVSAPPLSMKRKDQWGNNFWSEPDLGALINHRTCPWYSSQQILDARTKRAVCNFMAGKVEKVAEDVEFLGKIDDEERQLRASDLPNSYDRLVNGMKNGRMMATKEELALFQGKTRGPLLLAELAYETEDWKRANTLYLELETRFSESLNPYAQLYLDFVIGSCQKILGHEDMGVKRNNRVTASINSPTWPRAMMTKFNELMYQPGKETDALAVLDTIVAQRPRTDAALQACFVKAEYFRAKGKINEARPIYQSLLATVTAPEWVRIASQRYLLAFSNQ